MTADENPWVDLKRLRSLRDDFRSAAVDRPKLFHALRVVIDTESGTSSLPEHGWEEFLGQSEVFGVVAYERVIRGEQHSCYYGVPDRLTEYTGLAAVAQGMLTRRFVVMSSHRHYPQFDRDSWMLALYRIALNMPDDLPIDLQGPANYARTQPWDYLGDVVTGHSAGQEHEAKNLKAWQDKACQIAGYTPRYVYATLPFDVFRSSTIAVDYLLANAQNIYGPKRPSVLTRSPTFREAKDENAQAVLETTASESAEVPTALLRTRTNVERDKWIYEQVWKEELQYKEIISKLKVEAKETGWPTIESVQGIRAAALRYAKRSGKPKPPPRQPSLALSWSAWSAP